MEHAFLPPLGSETNAKFSIAFDLKIFVVFFSLRGYLYISLYANIAVLYFINDVRQDLVQKMGDKFLNLPKICQHE